MTNINVFGEETYFNKRATFFKSLEGELIITSSTGKKYKLVVDDSGNLSTELIS
jgi:hypothetical protein